MRKGGRKGGRKREREGRERKGREGRGKGRRKGRRDGGTERERKRKEERGASKDLKNAGHALSAGGCAPQGRNDCVIADYIRHDALRSHGLQAPRRLLFVE